MTTVTARTYPQESRALKPAIYLMWLAARFIGYAVIFFARDFTGDFLELGIGSGQVASGKDEIKAFDNDLYHYVSHLHLALSGFIASTGVAIVALSSFSIRRRQMWAWGAAVATPILALAVALPAHYTWGFDTLGHLGLVYLATVVFVVGAVLSLKALLETSR